MTCSCSTPCACRGSAATTDGQFGPFSQPKFFPGQLLTEDDLQALVRYTVGKNRLSNRFLHGAGVVCGLIVHCADKGTVAVTPGYALDCCGNDIVVECPEVINVNTLIAQLPKDGSCVDPCDADNGVRTYYVVVEYNETPTDPTAPYQTDDCWTATGCEFTRTQEGYRFALRCEPPPADPENLIDHARRCVTTGAKRLKTSRDSAAFAKAVVNESRRSMSDVDEAAKQLANRIDAADPDAVSATDLGSFGAALARLAQSEVSPATLTKLKTALGELVDAGKQQAESLVTARRFVRRVVGQAQPGALLFDDAARGVQLALDPTELRELGDSLREHRDWLLCEVAKVELVTDCTLRCFIEQTNVSSNDPEILEDTFERLYMAHQRLIHQCLCAAALAPCQPCDNLAVYLASIKVEQCSVIEVCNLVRRQVLSAPLIRHWLPVGWLEQALRKWCCWWVPAEVDLDLTTRTENGEYTPAVATPVVDEGVPLPPSVLFGRNLGGVRGWGDLTAVADALAPRLVGTVHRLGLTDVLEDIGDWTQHRRVAGSAIAPSLADVTAEEPVVAERPARKKSAAKKSAGTRPARRPTAEASGADGA